MHSKYILASAGLLGLSMAKPLRMAKRDPNAVYTGSAAVTTINDQDGIGAGSDTNTPYSGDGTTGQGWPAMDAWVSFEDMFNANKAIMQIGCDYFGQPSDSDQEIADIQSAIESIAQASQVDHRYILAVIMQESNGCVRAPGTNNGVGNPGLMQSFQGTHSCNDGYTVQNPCPTDEITGMINDGARGTETGPGLAEDLNTAESQGTTEPAQIFYRAARIYNSGSVCSDNLSDACGATASYVSDIANRLTGWLGN